jgi:hypothetical protein
VAQACRTIIAGKNVEIDPVNSTIHYEVAQHSRHDQHVERRMEEVVVTDVMKSDESSLHDLQLAMKTHQRTDWKDATVFRWSTVMSNRTMTNDTMKPETNMVAASAAPNQPSARWTVTVRTRTNADCAMNGTIQAERTVP